MLDELIEDLRVRVITDLEDDIEGKQYYGKEHKQYKRAWLGVLKAKTFGQLTDALSDAYGVDTNDYLIHIIREIEEYILS